MKWNREEEERFEPAICSGLRLWTECTTAASSRAIFAWPAARPPPGHFAYFGQRGAYGHQTGGAVPNFHSGHFQALAGSGKSGAFGAKKGWPHPPLPDCGPAAKGRRRVDGPLPSFLGGELRPSGRVSLRTAKKGEKRW